MRELIHYRLKTGELSSKIENMASPISIRFLLNDLEEYYNFLKVLLDFITILLFKKIDLSD